MKNDENMAKTSLDMEVQWEHSETSARNGGSLGNSSINGGLVHCHVCFPEGISSYPNTSRLTTTTTKVYERCEPVMVSIEPNFVLAK